MTIKALTHITAGFLSKCLSVEKLKQILDQLQDTDELYPNRVGNLSVIRNEEQIGYIDIGTESLELEEETS